MGVDCCRVRVAVHGVPGGLVGGVDGGLCATRCGDCQGVCVCRDSMVGSWEDATGYVVFGAMIRGVWILCMWHFRGSLHNLSTVYGCTGQSVRFI